MPHSMIASKPAIFVAVCCLSLGNYPAFAQNAPELRPYLPERTSDWNRQPRSSYPGTGLSQETTTFPSLPIPNGALHPPVPPRPPVESALPVRPDQAQANTPYATGPLNISNTKPSLAWRAHAYKLHRTQDTPQSRQLAGNHDDAIMALIGALPAQNLKVETLNSKAGELLAAPIDPSSRQRYIFTFCENSAGNVIVKGTALHASKQSSETVQKVLNGILSSGSRRGTL